MPKKPDISRLFRLLVFRDKYCKYCKYCIAPCPPLDAGAAAFKIETGNGEAQQKPLFYRQKGGIKRMLKSARTFSQGHKKAAA